MGLHNKLKYSASTPPPRWADVCEAFEGLLQMFEGDSAGTCTGRFLIVSIGGRAKGLVCADPGSKKPISARGKTNNSLLSSHSSIMN